MDKIKNLIEHFEGFAVQAYRCPAGVWTIGYGRTEVVKEGDTTDRDKEEGWLISRICLLQSEIVKYCRPVELNDNQLLALISFVYNVGLGAFQKSTLLKRIKAGDPQASDEFRKWVKGGGKVLPGLVKRREEERVIFDSKISEHNTEAS